jgi:hypothetical protein
MPADIILDDGYSIFIEGRRTGGDLKEPDDILQDCLRLCPEHSNSRFVHFLIPQSLDFNDYNKKFFC